MPLSLGLTPSTSEPSASCNSQKLSAISWNSATCRCLVRNEGLLSVGGFTNHFHVALFHDIAKLSTAVPGVSYIKLKGSYGYLWMQDDWPPVSTADINGITINWPDYTGVRYQGIGSQHVSVVCYKHDKRRNKWHLSWAADTCLRPIPVYTNWPPPGSARSTGRHLIMH